MPLPAAASASGHGNRLSSTSSAAPATAQMNSGQFHGRTITPKVASAAIPQVAAWDVQYHRAAASAVAIGRPSDPFSRAQAGLRTPANPSHNAIEPSAKLPRITNIAL